MAKQFKNYFQNKQPVKEGETRFIVQYEGFAVKFFTDIDAVDKESAKAYFKNFYPSAKFISIKTKK